MTKIKIGRKFTNFALSLLKVKAKKKPCGGKAA
jgi:hypothetical protein